MKFLAAFCLLGFLNCQHISVDVNIEEDGAQYKQIVEFDPESKAVTFRVPHHNQIVESVTIIHKKSNKMITMTKRRNETVCLLRDAPENFEPEAFALGAFYMSAKNKTLTPSEAKIINYLDYHKGMISQAERLKLLKAMQTLCEGIDIIEIEQIQVSDEEFLNRSVSPFVDGSFDNSVNQRFRRSPFTHTSRYGICDVSQSCSKYVSGGTRCYWEVIPMTGATHMQLEHVRSTEWDCVACCDEYNPDNGMCACSYITSDETYNECQHGLLNH